jgi:glycosyltransferase involved in cell wall biosynthesis
VVIPAYRARRELPKALESLRSQKFTGTFETIVVASGDDGWVGPLQAQFPDVIFIRSEKRLVPAEARNIGLRAARGDVVAFMPADAIALRGWLQARVMVHEAGADLVGGSIVSASSWNPVMCAEYLLEYSSLMPKRILLQDQTIPHAVSFRRSVFDRIGLYEENLLTGEDTLFNQRCLAAGLSVEYAPEAALSHDGNKTVSDLWGHAFAHGRGLATCVAEADLKSGIGDMSQPPAVAAWRMFVLYPALGMKAKIIRMARFWPRRLPCLLLLSPLIVLGMLATGSGAWAEYRTRRRRISQH